ncbi:MAG: trigger factor [Alphaproteobacteria bacterium]
MQVEETKNEGLSREFAITIPGDDIEGRVSARLTEIAATVKMPGFRPGKVPIPLLRKQYGPSVIGEVLERAISDTTAETLREKNLRPAMQPKIQITEFDEGKDLKFTMAVEVMPNIGAPDFGAIELERLVVDVNDAVVDEAIARMAEERRAFEATDQDRASTGDDALLVDFTGTVDGDEFAGGAAKDFVLELNAESFIPGFVEQMVGAKAGETRTIKVTFPDDYPAEELAGKEAQFEVVVKELQVSKPVEVNDDLAKAAGLESLDAMKAAVKERLSSEYASISRMRLKRGLLDKLALLATFDVPGGMVENEFTQIWQKLSGVALDDQDHDQDHGHDHGAGGHDHGDHEEARPDPEVQARFKRFLEESDKSEDEIKDEYRVIADRRVRLGLLLTETGRANNIAVPDEELNRAVAIEARRFPGQERQVVEHYQKDAAAREQLRAPLFEDKVVDFILELAKITDRTVTGDELLTDPDDEEEAGAGEDEAKQGASTEETAKKKPAAKKK